MNLSGKSSKELYRIKEIKYEKLRMRMKEYKRLVDEKDKAIKTYDQRIKEIDKEAKKILDKTQDIGEELLRREAKALGFEPKDSQEDESNEEEKSEQE